MKTYLVMECHLSYAVVLDEEGRFLKVANQHYAVGQTVTDVVEMQVPPPVSRKSPARKWIGTVAAMAACLMLVITAYFQQLPYASVYMTINPEVRIDVNRNDMVVGLEAINADGTELIEGYDHKKKELPLVMDELVDRAIAMGYLHEGGQISLVLDAETEDWVISHRDSLTTQLSGHLEETLTVTIVVNSQNVSGNQVTIPVESQPTEEPKSAPIPPANEQTHPDDLSGQQPEHSDYGDSLYDLDDGTSDYGDDSDDGLSDYGIDDDLDDGLSDYGIDDDDFDNSQSDYEIDDDDFDDGLSGYAFYYEADYDLSDYEIDDDDFHGGSSDYDDD